MYLRPLLWMGMCLCVFALMCVGLLESQNSMSGVLPHSLCTLFNEKDTLFIFYLIIYLFLCLFCVKCLCAEIGMWWSEGNFLSQFTSTLWVLRIRSGGRYLHLLSYLAGLHFMF